jgi:aspartate/methionine/tyrosine aminotransferase
LIIADEVYQNNVYKDGSKFYSFRAVLDKMKPQYRDNVELISLHSISKGIMGECGLRGGYFEAHNLDPFALDMLYKLKSIELCSNTIGQIGVALMVDPPTKGVESYDTVARYEKETTQIFSGLK